ncbi:hypothetical protein PQX77_010597 [Marasmius sp. AFHP31]|nr:hypothetical protein PQX77_010597 [Marasmius sp. AFHP31]
MSQLPIGIRGMKTKRSFTGHHTLLPSSSPSHPSRKLQWSSLVVVPLNWTLGRGSVIWRIWPAVLLHTVFAAVIVFLKMEKHVEGLAIPNVMLTVLGVVIGFVISYRAMSGYDRYWMGRSAWTDVIRNSRTMARLVWVHVPPRISTKGEETAVEVKQVMAEKRMALDLIEGFAVALKHYLRGETGIYYEDLYGLVRPLHEHEHPQRRETISEEAAAAASTSVDPYIPAINTYGTFLSRTSSHSSHNTQPLLPAPTPPSNVQTRIEKTLIPFAAAYDALIGPHKSTHPSLPGKHRLQPLQNLPWEILRCLSEWLSVLEQRGTAPGSLLGTLAAMEDSLGTVEKILSTPLPFVYSVHIRHTVWIYLFFLPFQLVKDFGVYTIPGVSIAAFIYLGFLAAGEEIEQPFGYDENDLELDMYCRDIIHVDIENLKRSVCLNAPDVGRE